MDNKRSKLIHHPEGKRDTKVLFAARGLNRMREITLRRSKPKRKAQHPARWRSLWLAEKRSNEQETVG